MKPYLTAVLALLVVVLSIAASANTAPHFRLYMNALGGGTSRAGYYFPHDEFYDASMRDLIAEIAKSAKAGARVASESPALATYYAKRANRNDLVCVELSDRQAISHLSVGDFVVIARGRRYFSNDPIIASLHQTSLPAFQLSLGSVPSAEVYLLDKNSLNVISEIVQQSPNLVSDMRLPRASQHGVN